jgi:hypothetical protein
MIPTLQQHIAIDGTDLSIVVKNPMNNEGSNPLMLCTSENMTTKATLENEILRILSDEALSNQEIRKRLNQERKIPNLQKSVINSTLHSLSHRGFLAFDQEGNDKIWEVVSIKY